MKYFIVAGERSGDQHAARLLSEICRLDPEAEATGIGGRFLEEAGMKILMDYHELAIMGFTEVFEKFSLLRKARKMVQQNLISQRPDCIILIDYGGFNLPLAKIAKSLGIKVFYYIPPKVWAWNEGRIRQLKEHTDRIFVILPFEKEYYAGHGLDVTYVGNPTLDSVADFRPDSGFRSKNRLDEKPIIAVLPGSRKSEIERSLFRILSILPAYPDHHFVVAAVDNLPAAYYNHFRRNGRVDVVFEQTYDLLANAEMAVVTSGTATLETALFRVPQVVVYATNTISYLIARLLIKVKFISLVNLIAGKKIVPELIQNEFSAPDLRVELAGLAPGCENREIMLEAYEELRAGLGEPGASAKCAAHIVAELKK